MGGREEGQEAGGRAKNPEEEFTAKAENYK